MKQTRYAAYQPLLKALAQSAIATRPAGVSEGELLLKPGADDLHCHLLTGPQSIEVQADPRVLASAQELGVALLRDGLPWVACRLGFFRKQVGWGVRVRITPSEGAPELDLTSDRTPSPSDHFKATQAFASSYDPSDAPVPSVVEPGFEPSMSIDSFLPTQPGLDAQPPALPELVAPDEDPSPHLPKADASLAMPLIEMPLDEDWSPELRPASHTGVLNCPQCHRQSLALQTKRDGMDQYRCTHCRYDVAMHATPDFDDSDYARTRPQQHEAGETGQALQRDAQGRVIGPGYAVQVLSPETLMYETSTGKVPMHIVSARERGARVIEVNRVTMMDTAFGSRMLTPREHAAIVQNLQACLSLLPGRFVLE
jgi:hypothetical protein